MTFTPAPKPEPRKKKRTGFNSTLPQRSKRMVAKENAEGRAHLSKLRVQLYREQGHHCGICGRWLSFDQTELAHRHPCGNRYKPDYQCPRCETFTNHTENLVVVCRSPSEGDCNKAADNEFKAAGGCRRRE